MSHTSIDTPREARLVPCPDCGASFVPRGIAAHRRMKHGLCEAPASTSSASRSQPAANESTAIATLLAPALEKLASVLARIDARLAALESKSSPAAPSDEAVALESHLSAVIEEIDRVKSESTRLASAWAGRPQTDEQRALEETTFMHLGTLRRQQARLLFDLQDLKGDREMRIDCIQ